jgi:hypothetical protein
MPVAKSTFKDRAKTALPDPAVRQISRALAWRARKRNQRTKSIDLSRVELIRMASKEQLTDPAYLEHRLLPSLGLNDEYLWQVPSSLHRYTGYGLRHWQLPNQFSRYLLELSNHDVESYLEIGSRHGGTFVITVEYLDRFHPIRNAVAVDLARSRSLQRYAAERDGVKVLQADTRSETFKGFLREAGLFDLVMIDGDHKEAGCRSDFELVKHQARLIVFHDIASDAVPGVGKVWREVKATERESFRFLEFAEPHPDKTEGVVDFGLGLAIRKAD